MAKDKKLVEAITSMDVDFAQWYTDVVKKAELMDYSSVKGCMVIKPAGYAIWENIQGELDRRFKETGVENVYMPMFIPESLLQKEKDHVDGFAPEVAWVTHGGLEPLQERLCVRPTSETLFCDFYSREIQSYRDLPKLYNQWCSVVRWEKTTRPFLRSREFLWQEGHTAHATAKEAEERTEQMLNLYANFCEEVLAMPVIRGQKTDKEKFAGAEATYTIEALMHDGKALQSGTSHNFGDGFAKAFEIQYSDKENKLSYVHQTSWGLSTRLIGGIIMVHGDDNGLVLPPKIAPVQVIIVPVQQQKEGVLDKALELKGMLSNFRVKVDDSDKSPGWKFSESEMRGIPIRVEIGPRDIEQNQAVLVRRDTHEKIMVSLDELDQQVRDLLDDIQKNMYEKAKNHRDEHTSEATDLATFTKTVEEKPGFVKAMWCGCQECEDQIKESTGATSRCIPFEQKTLSDTCICCGKPAVKMVYWGRAY
ncbi:proline--tRNA ligase [Lacrimispora algidixylanolytica]|uniref:Proline--tRNA ligase n=1 Tax=Lacrimispora algidixylanolytica TaxID=94868 RepID=A0A419T1I6_9FIRM|nr:proline--tRNA ligase [Lacrimispora algidixylanolytica]RKD31424.1 proline--tRNA ligase [Lacrimispora algidixylanolytica]